MTRRRCCCGCTMFLDNFNRAESSILGRSWYEPPSFNGFEIDWYCPSGTPIVNFGALHAPYGLGSWPSEATGTGTGTDAPGWYWPITCAAVWEQPHQDGVYQMQNRIYVLDDDDLFTTGLVVELHLAIEYDPDTKSVGGMHIARLVYGPSNQRIDLLTRSGYDGAEKILASTGATGMTAGNIDTERSACAAPDDIRRRRLFTATMNEEAFCANIENAPIDSVFAAPDWTYYGSGDRWYGGVGASSLPDTETEQSIWMDNWELRKTYDTDTDCPYCICKCLGIAMPDTLTITLRSSGCMGGINGSSAFLSWDYDDGAWTGTMVTACVTWNFTLTCPALDGDSPQGYLLEVTGSCLDSDPCGHQRKASYFSTCDPLWLVFGCTDESVPDSGTGTGQDCDHDPFKVSKSDLACPCCTPDLNPPGGYHGWYCFEVTA